MKINTWLQYNIFQLFTVIIDPNCNMIVMINNWTSDHWYFSNLINWSTINKIINLIRISIILIYYFSWFDIFLRIIKHKDIEYQLKLIQNSTYLVKLCVFFMCFLKIIIIMINIYIYYFRTIKLNPKHFHLNVI